MVQEAFDVLPYLRSKNKLTLTTSHVYARVCRYNEQRLIKRSNRTPVTLAPLISEQCAQWRNRVASQLELITEL